MKFTISGCIIWRHLGEFLVRALCAVILVFTARLRPRLREVPVELWHKYSYPYSRRQTVPTILLCVICLVFLFVTIVAVCIRYFLFRSRCKDKQKLKLTNLLSDVIGCIWDSMLLMTIVASVCYFIKATVARPRPHFIHRCQPKNFDFNLMDYSKLGRLPTCRTDTQKALSSFPSTHSALIFAFVAYSSSVFNETAKLTFLKSLASVRYVFITLLYFIAIFVAVSRVKDYYHHTEDIIVGGILGFCAGTFVYYFYSRIGAKYSWLTHDPELIKLASGSCDRHKQEEPEMLSNPNDSSARNKEYFSDKYGDNIEQKPHIMV